MGNQLQFYSNIACLYVSFDAKLKIDQNNIFTEVQASRSDGPEKVSRSQDAAGKERDAKA